MKKPTKAEAFALIKTLQNSLLETDPNQIHLEKLYQFFIPAAPKAKSPEAWVFKATTKKSREALNYILAGDGWLVATDGHRLHAARATRLEKQLLNAALDPVDLDPGCFPDWKRILPEAKHTQTWTRADADLQECSDGKTWAYILPSGHIVNKTYWDEAVNGRDEVPYTYDEEAGPVRIDTDEALAVVMPRRSL